MRESTLFTVAGVTFITGLVAYAFYFDYKRRNDVEFRKKLRKDKKRVDKSVAQTHELAGKTNAITSEEVKAALEVVKGEAVPAAAEDKEQYFMSQVSMGEQLSTQGPTFHLPAALCFYRALRVYPSPVELIVIYQKTVPEPIFKIVMEMTNLDAQAKIEGYYEHYPPKRMNVSAELTFTTNSEGEKIGKRILVVNKDFAPGDVIYKENPVATVLDFDLEGKGTHCSQCLRVIQPGLAIKPPSDRLASTYCSKDCQLKHKSQSHNLLFTLEPPLPPELSPGILPVYATQDRDKAQKAFVKYIQDKAKAVPLLAARCIARQVAAETQKMMPTTQSSDVPEADGGEYSLYDHIERLRYLEVTSEDQEVKLLRQVLQNALPGLEQFITDERHSTLVGKMAYNAYGVCFGGGRADKPGSKERPEDVEKTRTPYGTSRQVGSAFYIVSSYIAHSCSPSARPSFSSGTSALHLIANRPLKKGDEITVSYVDVTIHPDETPAQARLRRRKELVRGWRFACQCEQCVKDGSGLDGLGNDESKVEAVAGKATARSEVE